MSYQMTVKLQHPYYYSAALAKRDALDQRLRLELGGAGQLVSIADQVEHVVVGYGVGNEYGDFDSHQTVLQTVEWAAGQLFIHAVEAEVVHLVQYGIQASVIGAAGALGATAKLHPFVRLIAAIAGGVGGYAVGQRLPIKRAILSANRHPAYGWQWKEVQPPQFRSSETA